MSSTRRQESTEREFRPDGYASSPEFNRGIQGNLVAARCRTMDNTDVVTVIYWLQQVSWRQGSLEHFAAEFMRENADQVGTVSMLEFGTKPGTVYSPEQIHAIRSEFRGRSYLLSEHFPLRGERPKKTRVPEIKFLSSDEIEEELDRIAAEYPESYQVEDFLDRLDFNSAALADLLRQWIVDPGMDLSRGYWKLPNLFRALQNWMDAEAKAARHEIVETTVTKQVFEELDYCLSSRTFVLIEGREGIGKSEGAKNWCAARPGRAIYVKLASGYDEATLYRSIARQLGTASTYGRKATEMKARIEDTLQAGHLMLVLDEAHFLWPSSNRSERSVPKRIDWLRTAIIDFDVPVALISTPQHFEKSCGRFEATGWNTAQIERRLAHTTLLPEPEKVPLNDLFAVAEHYFPQVGRRAIEVVAATALGSIGFLSTIKHLSKRVAFLLERDSSRTETEHLVTAIAETGINEETASEALGRNAMAGSRAAPSTVRTEGMEHRRRQETHILAGASSAK